MGKVKRGRRELDCEKEREKCGGEGGSWMTWRGGGIGCERSRGEDKKSEQRARSK